MLRNRTMMRAGARLRALAGLCALLLLVGLPVARAALGAPQIQQPAEGALVRGYERDVVISGTGQPGNTIEVFDSPATSLGTTTVANNGVWTKRARLTDGAHAVYAIASDGTSSTPPSDARSFTVDAVQPTAGIDRPADQYIFGPRELLEIRGTAGDDRKVHAIRLEYWLLNKLVLEALATCNGCGTTSATWAHQPTSLQPGYYVVKAYTFDQAGNRSEPRQRGFTTAAERLPLPGVDDPVIPGAPGIPSVSDPDPYALLPGADRPIVIGGSGDPGSSIGVNDRRRGILGIVETEEDGTWSISQRLPSGTYRIRVRATNDDGASSVLSKVLTFTVDADRPTLTVLTDDGAVFGPLEPVVLEGKLFDNNRVAAVRVEYWLLDKLALQEWARCIGCSDQEGIWRSRPELANPGYYHVKITAFDKSGNPSWTQVTSFVKTI